MASLTSAAEHAVVIALMKQQQWLSISGWPAIGLYRTDRGSPWQWLTGEPVNYQPWATGEPSVDGVFAQLWGTGTTPNLTWVANGNSTVSSAVIEWSADCNADGIVDYGQILAGELPDANGNNIPDCCEGGVACDPCAAADLIANGQIDGVDLALLISAWGTDGGKFPQADIDRDGIVSGSDLALLLSYWGPCD